MTKEDLITKVISIAQAEVGYVEKKTNSQLDSKTLNAGSNNYTKYGRDMHALYPSVMDFPAAWCDCFVDWCFYQAVGVANAKGLLCGDFNDYTIASAQLYKNKGSYYHSPQVGDQIFFNNGKRICHTGIVYNIDSNYVYTIEGNTSSGDNSVISNGGCVAQKKYKLTYNRIDGYGRPNYGYYADKPSKVLLRDIIDVSHHNTINFLQAKSQFTDVIIRVGYRSYQTGALTVDKRFVQHSKAAIEANFNMGFYLWDQSINEKEAIEQADWVVGLIKPLPVSYPIYIDSEYYNSKRQGRADNLSKEQRTKNIIAFCERIKELGYIPGVYASDSWFKTQLDFPRVQKYEIWCARYSTSSPTIPKYDIWQYGSNIILGASSPIDVNHSYKDYPSILAQTSNKADSQNFYCSVTANSLNVRNKPNVITGKILKTLKKGAKVNVILLQNGWCKISKDNSEYCSYKYLKPTVGKISNCQKLNCRKTPSTGQIMFVLSQNDSVNILNQDETTGWYYIEFGGKTGYISNKYVTIV